MPFKRAHWPGLDEREYRMSQGHDAAAALVVDGECVAAAAEERFNRRKHSGDFPAAAICYCLAEALLALAERDCPGVPAERVQHVGHHLAHAASAYFTSGWDDCLVVVADGMGGAHGVSVYRARGGRLETLHWMHTWFDVPPRTELPYMIVTVNVREPYRRSLPAITHVNGSARVQTVSATDDSAFHALLRAVGRLTGREMVLNTRRSSAPASNTSSSKTPARGNWWAEPTAPESPRSGTQFSPETLPRRRSQAVPKYPPAWSRVCHPPCHPVPESTGVPAR